MQWEDGLGGEGGRGEEGDAVSCITAVGAHQPCENDGGRANIKRWHLLWITYMCSFTGMADIHKWIHLELLVVTLQKHHLSLRSFSPSNPNPIRNQRQKIVKMITMWKNVLRLTRIERVTFRCAG